MIFEEAESAIWESFQKRARKITFHGSLFNIGIWGIFFSSFEQSMKFVRIENKVSK